MFVRNVIYVYKVVYGILCYCYLLETHSYITKIVIAHTIQLDDWLGSRDVPV